jgi:predicted nicotinamide N-methyase
VVYVTDIHEPTLNNAAFNARLNGTKILSTATSAAAAATVTETATTKPHAFIEEVEIIHNSSSSASTSASISPNITETDGTGTSTAEDSGTKSTDTSTILRVSNVSWSDPATFPPEKVDVLLGSDLVYDSKILGLFAKAVDGLLADGKQD